MKTIENSKGMFFSFYMIFMWSLHVAIVILMELQKYWEAYIIAFYTGSQWQVKCFLSFKQYLASFGTYKNQVL